MRRVLRAALRDAPPGVPTELRTMYRGRLLRLSGEQLDVVRTRVLRGRVLPNNARREAAAALLDALWQDAQQRGSDVDRATLVAELGDRTEFDRLPGRLVAGAHAGRGARLARRPRPAGPCRPGRAQAGGAADDLAASWSRAGWSVADVALLDELRVLLGEPGGARTQEFFYGHVIVDEAQDLSPMQWRMLGRRGRYASWTIVGDPAQSSWPDRAEADTARERALGRVKTRRQFVLRTNYRNSAEIFDLAASVVRDEIGADDLPVAVRSTGCQPSIRRPDAGDVPATVLDATRELLDEVDGTVGVISAMARRDEVAGWLAGLAADERLRIMGSLEAKGLEFDAVVLVEPAELITESATGRRALYVALTRATQRLTVIASDAAALDWLPEPVGVAAPSR